MLERKLGAQTLVFNNFPRIKAAATVVGPLEGEGPLGSCYDIVYPDQTLGHKSWEASERAMMKEAVNLAITKGGLTSQDIDYMLAGDLLNQIITCNFAARDLGIPFLGLYGACSSFAESLGLAAVLVDGGYASHTVAAVSSHYGTSERQYRYPTEYGGQRPPYSQTTVTGSGAALVSQADDPHLPAITHFTIGRVLDMGIKDPFDMGSAMAPAAMDTLQRHLLDTGRSVADYDLILTGDLASVGKKIMLELAKQEGINLKDKYDDCGCRVFDLQQQPVFAGGSGCACSAVVTLGSVLPKVISGELQRVLIIATGALLSPLTFQQGESIPCIAHAVVLEQLAKEAQ
ncbi:MAG: stage V sporulation protein AD [Firmicutes bacterium]|nr:stage V sporulation protein AD [Bacillota bacterium]